MLESLVIQLPKNSIDYILSGYPELEVVASRFTEDGWELIIEGDGSAIAELVEEVQDA